MGRLAIVVPSPGPSSAQAYPRHCCPPGRISCRCPWSGKRCSARSWLSIRTQGSERARRNWPLIVPRRGPGRDLAASRFPAPSAVDVGGYLGSSGGEAYGQAAAMASTRARRSEESIRCALYARCLVQRPHVAPLAPRKASAIIPPRSLNDACGGPTGTGSERSARCSPDSTGMTGSGRHGLVMMLFPTD